ncbi:hypothetical protein ACFVVX_19640 [Kitasatospora sp. NPDC058170]|uniref:hypothetical protein n=1 Tax=Kitasatospora sp. NPDC058170 TaxID=3346364 RepID=UPI0036DECB04
MTTSTTTKAVRMASLIVGAATAGLALRSAIAGAVRSACADGSPGTGLVAPPAAEEPRKCDIGEKNCH